ncbi:hypothetical protein [Tardiphaga sp.]|uniref:hypothetical protein n=1 Tax=Tardiphaga sp. TaxID=1926292 RepID=UPI0037DA613C
MRDLPDDAQDAVARMVLDLVAEGPVELTAEEAASFEESLAQAERGEFASDEAVRAIWAKHGL